MSFLSRTLRLARFAKPLQCPLCKSNRINGTNFYRCGSTDYVQSVQCSENIKITKIKPRAKQLLNK